MKKGIADKAKWQKACCVIYNAAKVERARKQQDKWL